jgi:hypothetical protein
MVGTARDTEPRSPGVQRAFAHPTAPVPWRHSRFTFPNSLGAQVRSPAADHARVMRSTCPRKARGRRECRVKASPMARVQQKSTRQNHRLSRSSGIPCAMVLTLIRDLPGDRLSCPRLRQCACAPCADLSTGRPGPHDFTSVMRRSSARASASCDTPRPPHPRLTCRDDRAQRPSQRGGMAHT